MSIDRDHPTWTHYYYAKSIDSFITPVCFAMTTYWNITVQFTDVDSTHWQSPVVSCTNSKRAHFDILPSSIMPQMLNQPSIVDHRNLLDRYFNSSVRRKPIIIRYSVCSMLIYTSYQRIKAKYLSLLVGGYSTGIPVDSCFTHDISFWYWVYSGLG